MNGSKNIRNVPLPEDWTHERMCGPGKGKFYDYLFLDPRKLPKDGEMTFKTFVEAIFYVGEGTYQYKDEEKDEWYLTKQRSYKHLYLYEEETVCTVMKLCICTCTCMPARSVLHILFSFHQQSMKDRIMAIRESKEKTKVAHFFVSDIQNDKSTREACMIKAIGKLDSISGYYVECVYNSPTSAIIICICMYRF